MAVRGGGGSGPARPGPHRRRGNHLRGKASQKAIVIGAGGGDAEADRRAGPTPDREMLETPVSPPALGEGLRGVRKDEPPSGVSGTATPKEGARDRGSGVSKDPTHRPLTPDPGPLCSLHIHRRHRHRGHDLSERTGSWSLHPVGRQGAGRGRGGPASAAPVRGEPPALSHCQLVYFERPHNRTLHKVNESAWFARTTSCARTWTG